MSKRREYVGISGVVNQEQQDELEQIHGEVGLADKRVLQFGVKATHKPQYLGIENRYGREWYPVGDEIVDVLRYSPNSTGVAQVCFDSERVHDAAYREEFLWRALGSTTHRWLTGLQFDMMPDWVGDSCATSETIENGVYYLEDSAKDLTITLQCQGEIMKRHSPAQIAEALATQALRPIDYVLFDASCGRGVRMNADALLPYVEAIHAHSGLEHLQVAVGGGLNGEVVRAELPKITKYFPDVSWDAEGQLHPANSDGKRPLDMRMCRDYIEASADVVR